jgi:integrase
MLKVAAMDSEVVEVETPREFVRTLADVRDRLLQLAGGNSWEVKLQVSAINTVARASGCAPDDLPADPALLRQHLSTISPAMAGLTIGSWSSVRSRILKALQRAEVPVMAGRRTKPLSEEWALLYRALFENGKQAALGRLIGYLSDRGVSPAEVSDSHVERFSRELNTSSLRGRPGTIVRCAIRGWNAAVDQVPGWPQQRLTPGETGQDNYVLPAESFPASFRSSLTQHIAFLADPPEDDDAPPKGLRPTTLRLREFQFRQMASALVHRGVPAEEIATIGALAQRENVDLICDFFIERLGRTDCVQLDGFLRILRSLALHRLQDRELAEWIRRRLRRLSGRGRRFGMTEKNRRRLAVFRDPQHVRQLLLLPYRLLKRAGSGSLDPGQAAQLMRAAVAIEIEIMCPIRLQNLSEINVDTDLVRSHAGRNATVHLFIPGKRTKNGEDIELELPRQSMALIDLYLTKYRHHLIEPKHRGRGPRFLFPKSNGEVKVGKVLADGICRVLQRELGIKFNMHLFRHLGCFLYLRSHPGQIDVMRRVLGHRDADTTLRFYASIEQSDAFRLFDSHVLQVREEALRPSRKIERVSRGHRQ